MSGGLLFGKNKDKGDPQDTPERFTPLNHQEMNEFCLECYLLRIKEMLCSGSFPDGYDINTIAVEISFIYESLLVDYVSLTYNHSPTEKQVNSAAFKKASHKLLVYTVASSPVLSFSHRSSQRTLIKNI